MISHDDERQELERVVELLGSSTRPGRLLAYIGAKVFAQQQEHLTEFNIAIEVFGRSAKTFDPAQDAVVRVEAHRLRKKLRELYEKDASPQRLHIVLPSGTYIPTFSPAPEPQRADVPTDQLGSAREDAASATDADVAASAAGSRRIPKRALYLLSAVGVVCAAIVGLVIVGEPRSIRDASPHAKPLQRGSTGAPQSTAAAEVHIMAGYSGSEVIDNSGVRWTPDRFFTGGGPWARDGGFIRGTSRPFLFANWRSGEFGYDIPLERGTYEMRLFFVSPHRVGDEKLAGFDVALNGKPLLVAYDVNISARGVDVADEKVFKDIVPDQDGFVRLRFTNQIGTPSLSALELGPGTPGKLRPIRISMQPTAFVDHKGQLWRADDYYLNGFRSTERRAVSGTDDPELFGAERYGHFSYAIPVDPKSRYTVVLHFAEFYFGPQLQGGGGAGSRVFHVYCNGQTLLENFDVYKEAGSLRLVTKTFSNVKPSAQGKINLTFEPAINNATVSGIEVLDEA